MYSAKWLQKLADSADLTGETLPGVPILEIAGDSRVLIEQHEGVLQYSREEIGIRVSYGIVVVHGCNLELMKMTKEQLVISGQIDCVALQRKGR